MLPQMHHALMAWLPFPGLYRNNKKAMSDGDTALMAGTSKG